MYMYCLSSPVHTNHIKWKKHEGIQQNLWDEKHSMVSIIKHIFIFYTMHPFTNNKTP